MYQFIFALASKALMTVALTARGSFSQITSTCFLIVEFQGNKPRCDTVYIPQCRFDRALFHILIIYNLRQLYTSGSVAYLNDFTPIARPPNDMRAAPGDC